MNGVSIVTCYIIRAKITSSPKYRCCYNKLTHTYSVQNHYFSQSCVYVCQSLRLRIFNTFWKLSVDVIMRRIWVSDCLKCYISDIQTYLKIFNIVFMFKFYFGKYLEIKKFFPYLSHETFLSTLLRHWDVINLCVGDSAGAASAAWDIKQRQLHFLLIIRNYYICLELKVVYDGQNEIPNRKMLWNVFIINTGCFLCHCAQGSFIYYRSMMWNSDQMKTHAFLYFFWNIFLMSIPNFQNPCVWQRQNQLFFQEKLEYILWVLIFWIFCWSNHQIWFITYLINIKYSLSNSASL